MRIFATVSLLVALFAGMPRSGPAQDGPGTQTQGRPRIVAVLSDELTYSPLVTCPGDVLRVSDQPRRSRIVSWNIRAARSAPVEAIAAELRDMEADVVALQEVDVRTRRSGFVDEPTVLAHALGFHFVFAASIKWDEGDYGLAVLSRWPLVDIRRHRIEHLPGAEPRIILETTVCANGRPLRLFNHHADGRAASRDPGFVEVRRILEDEVGRGILVAGDFNELPDAPGVNSLLDAGLIDLGGESPTNTADSGRIDYLLADDPLARLMSSARVWITDKSDHHAVLADLEW